LPTASENKLSPRPPVAFADGVEVAQEIVRRVFAGIEAPIAIALADGTPLLEPNGQPEATIILSQPAILRVLLARASDLDAGEAVVRGDIAVEGDIERALFAMDAVAASRTTREWIALAALAAKLPQLPPSPQVG
jgi:hypothetical protein